MTDRFDEMVARTRPHLQGDKAELAVIGRARHALGVAAAVADVNSRLGTKASKIETVMTYCCRTDTDSETGKQFPVMFLDETALSFLRIHPSNHDVVCALVLGVWVDPHFGPIPVLFIWTSKKRKQRIVAAIWTNVKCHTADRSEQLTAFKNLEEERQLIHATDRGSEGGIQRISGIGIYVQGENGLDVKFNSHYVPFKLWNALTVSVVRNGVADVLVATAKPWPYPSEIEGGIVEKTLAAAGFNCWY
jgi:hypothetical protein